jgi:hypothetical protein
MTDKKEYFTPEQEDMIERNLRKNNTKHINIPKGFVTEQFAELLHNWYLEATKELHPESYNTKAQKPYSELTDEQKQIDRFIAVKLRLFIQENAIYKSIYDRRVQLIRDKFVKFSLCREYGEHVVLFSRDIKEINAILSGGFDDKKGEVDSSLQNAYNVKRERLQKWKN